MRFNAAKLLPVVMFAKVLYQARTRHQFPSTCPLTLGPDEAGRYFITLVFYDPPERLWVDDPVSKYLSVVTVV